MGKLEELREFHRNRNKGRHNVIVPYSGGKDGIHRLYIKE